MNDKRLKQRGALRLQSAPRQPVPLQTWTASRRPPVSTDGRFRDVTHDVRQSGAGQPQFREVPPVRVSSPEAAHPPTAPSVGRVDRSSVRPFRDVTPQGPCGTGCAVCNAAGIART